MKSFSKVKMGCCGCEEDESLDEVRSCAASRLADCRDEEARLGLEAMQAEAEVDRLAFKCAADVILCDDEERSVKLEEVSIDFFFFDFVLLMWDDLG